MPRDVSVVMTTGAERYPDFFKVFHPERHYERMLIPNAFVRLPQLLGRMSEDVILRNASGRVWHVKTCYIGESVFFYDGWKAFHEENCLEKADFLVFKHDRNNEFKVLLLESSTQCEKAVVKMEEEEEENEEEKAAAQEVEETEIMEEEEEEEEEEDISSESEDYDDDDDDEENTEMEEESEEELSAGFKHHRRGACKRDAASSSNPNGEDRLQDYVFDPDMCIQPDNKYFKANLYKTRPNELHIPGTAILEFSLIFPEKITLICCQPCQRKDIHINDLRDHHNLAQHTLVHKKYQEVTGRVCRWQDERICIKGWQSFCRRNKIEKDDICFCEVLSGEDQIVRTLRVHVARRT